MDIQRRGTRILLIFLIPTCLDPSLVLARGAAQTKSVEQYSQEAEQALARKDLPAASAALEKLAQLAPDSAEVQANLGMVYYNQGRMLDATKAFQRALELNPKISNVELMLGICYAEVGRHREAVLILEPAFRQPPDKTTRRLIGLELQRAYVGLKHFEKASAVADELLRSYPDDPEILYHSGRLFGDRALQLMLRLVDVAPNSTWMLQARAEAHESQKRYDLAIAGYRRILELEPHLPGIHFRLGRALLLGAHGEKVREEAAAAFRKELEIDPLNADAWYEIGELHRQAGEMEPARQAFLNALEFHPDFEEAQIALARTLINLKRPREALPHLLTAIRLNPTNEVSHFQLAAVYRALGDQANYDKEMALYRRYHSRPYADASRDSELVGPFAAPRVTKQTVDAQQTEP